LASSESATSSSIVVPQGPVPGIIGGGGKIQMP